MGRPRVRGTFAVVGCVLMSVFTASCAQIGMTRVPVEAGATRDALRFSRQGVRVEYAQGIDRYTFFGPDSGPNLLHTVGLDREAQPGQYVFFGGAYSWTAPQNGPGGSVGGWIAPDESPRGWPPDPAMDTGPCAVEAAGERGFVATGPQQRTGLREVKTFEIIGARTARLTYRLNNEGASPVLAGPWLNTAVAPGAVVAFRMGKGDGFEVRGAMGDNAVASFTGALSPTGPGGWRTLDLSRHPALPEVKVFIDAGDRAAEIAVWREGWWLHRTLTSGDADSHARQRAMSEGPVAFYANSGLGIFEAELVAPFAEIAPAGHHQAVEVWTLIKSETPDVTALPR